MGCDIEVYCEGFLPNYYDCPMSDYSWINIDHWIRTNDGPTICADSLFEDMGFTVDDINKGVRNYKLFYLLAGVRGCDEYTSYPPISKPKGIPRDMDPIIKKWYIEHFEIDFNVDTCDCHSASYLTLAEIKKSGYAEEIELEGWVKEDDFEDMIEKVRKREYTFPEFVDVKMPIDFREGLVYRKWKGYLNICLLDLVEKLEQYKLERDIISDYAIRIVFWFDN